jgi:excisionase family DNA binding protein
LGERTGAFLLGGLAFRRRVDPEFHPDVGEPLGISEPAVAHGIEAALLTIEAQGKESAETHRQIELALQQARFEAERARRQYDAIEPENRLVAAELERRWNERLIEVQRLQERLAVLQASSRPSWDEAERQQLLALGADIARAWHHPKATSATRKRILRVVLNEVVARVEGSEIALLLHWQGGDHSALRVPKYIRGRHRWTTPEDTSDMIRALARLMPDSSIAATLNRAGRRTGRGHTWTEKRVCTFRHDHDIPPYREGERAERGELTLGEAAIALGMSKMTVLRLIRDGTISARQLCKGAPWVIDSQVRRPAAGGEQGARQVERRREATPEIGVLEWRASAR